MEVDAGWKLMRTLSLMLHSINRHKMPKNPVASELGSPQMGGGPKGLGLRSPRHRPFHTEQLPARSCPWGPDRPPNGTKFQQRLMGSQEVL